MPTLKKHKKKRQKYCTSAKLWRVFDPVKRKSTSINEKSTWVTKINGSQGQSMIVDTNQQKSITIN